MDGQKLLPLIAEFLVGAKLHIVLALVALDVVLGIAAALRRKEFQWRAVGDFYVSMVLPYLVGYLALYVVGQLLPGVLGEYIGAGMDYIAFAAIVFSLGGSIAENLKCLRLGPVLPSTGEVWTLSQ